MNAGFDCFIEIERTRWLGGLLHRKAKVIGAEGIGITPDFQLTSKLYYPVLRLICRRQFLQLNRGTIDRERQACLSALQSYRSRCRTEALRKHQTLSYNFHVNVYCRSNIHYLDLTETLRKQDVNPDVIGIPEVAKSGMIYLFERISVVNQSDIHRWW